MQENIPVDEFLHLFSLKLNFITMKNLGCMFLFLILFVICTVLPGTAFAQDDNFDRYIQQRMELEQMHSLSIAVVDEDGEVTFKSYGYADPENRRPADAHTFYEVGSVTKTFTASLFLMLADEYNFSLDVPFNELVEGSQLRLPVLGEEAITLKHLVTHFSGLPRLPGNMDPENHGDPYKDYTIAQLLEFAGSVEPARLPGEGMEYSNFAYMLLGYAAEHVAERPFDDLIREYITGPLGMNETFRVIPESDMERFAVPTAFGTTVDAWHFDELRGLGELRSSASDMAQYLKAHAGHLDDEHWTVLTKGHEKLVVSEGGFELSFGWFFERTEDETDVVLGHGGGTGGFRSFAGFSPESGRAAVVLTNSVADVSDITLHLINPAFELNPLPEPGSLPEETLAGLKGFFQHESLGVMTVDERDGVLTGQLQGQPALPLEHEEGFLFRNRQVAAQIEFEWSGDKAGAMVLRQGGGEFRFVRIDEMPKGPEKIEMTKDELLKYEGNYNSDMGLSYQIQARDGHLSARLTGQPAADVFPEGDDHFFYEAVVATLQFHRDDDGKIDAVVLHQAGQEIRFRKVKE